MHERIREMVLGAWGHTCSARPVATLTVCLLLAAVSLVLTATRLEFRPDRSDLIDPSLSWNRRYAQYKEHFHRWDDLIVCFDGPADDKRIGAFTRRLARSLAEDPRIVAADAGFDVAETGPRLFAAAPDALFAEALAQIAEARRIAASPNSNAALSAVLERLAGSEEDEASLERLADLMDPYLVALEGGEPDFAFLRPSAPHWLPLVSVAGSGRLRFIQVQFADLAGSIDQVSANLHWLRQRIGEQVQAADLPLVTWGVTGIPAIEADETSQSIRDSTVASLLALTLITILMLAVFRGIVVPLLAAGSLLIGLCWSFGWLVLAVGHLQLLSVVFSVILLGLGIDFALHLVSRLELVQDEHPDLPSAMSRVFRGIGPGMLTGAVTTAAAFGATALTKFKGMAEMGIIAGGGILLCLVAVLSSFPAALAVTGRWKRIIRHRPGGETALFAAGHLDAVDFHPWTTLLVGSVVVVGLGLASLSVRYDPNILNLHPPGIESVIWEKRIVEDEERTVWAALFQTTPDGIDTLVDRLRTVPEVSDVGAMGLLRPPDRAERAARIADVRERVVEPPAAAPGIDGLRTRLGSVRFGLLRRADGSAGSAMERVQALAGRIESALRAVEALDDAERTRRVERLDEAFAGARDQLAVWTAEALAPVPPCPEDLPALLREQWTDGDVWLVQAFPAPDPAGRPILDPDLLGPFITALRRVDGGVFGPPVQIYESSELIKREYVKAACFAAAAILVLLLLDFRSLGDSLCAIMPVLIGFIGTFGLMGLFSFPLNFANIIVMPLIFGIGVDAGVHIVHRWRAEPYGRPAGLSGGTGRGITLTMASTMIGFGCMLIAEHRGIRSLGFAMLAGLGVCLMACYTVLPAVLRLRTTHWSIRRS